MACPIFFRVIQATLTEYSSHWQTAALAGWINLTCQPDTEQLFVTALLQLLSRLPDRISVQWAEKAAAGLCSERVDGGMFHIFPKFALAVVQEHQISICIIIQYILVVQKGLTGLLNSNAHRPFLWCTEEDLLAVIKCVLHLCRARLMHSISPPEVHTT